MSDIPDSVLAFSLDLLAGARAKALPLDVCTEGHLVVKGNSHYKPLRFADGLRTIACQLIERCDA